MFKWYIMEVSLLVQNTKPLGLTKLFPVLPHVIEFVLIPNYSFVNWDNALLDPLGVARLNAWD